ncbi:hypothetical protein NHP20013_00280 [Helicobacter bizzozeronii]|nr:hypothetical protein NHP20013_00280 [Helicobacter bizzozeronii]
MQAPDITAGRSGLAALSDALGHFRGAHAHLNQSLRDFNDQLAKRSANAYNILNNEELKAHQRLQDKIKNEQNERALKLQEEGFKYQQMQDKIKNAQNERRINIEAQNVKGMNALRGWQGRQIKANTLTQQVQNFNLGGLMQQSDDAQTMIGGNAIRAQSGLLPSSKAKKPPLALPMTRQ